MVKKPYLMLLLYLPALLYLPSTTPFYASVSKGAVSAIFFLRKCQLSYCGGEGKQF